MKWKCRDQESRGQERDGAMQDRYMNEGVSAVAWRVRYKWGWDWRTRGGENYRGETRWIFWVRWG